MELKDIKELMKVLKNEEMSELKVRYGKIKLTLTNSGQYKEEPKIENAEEIKESVVEEVVAEKAKAPAKKAKAKKE